ncbi:HNH endonuclease [Gordonia phage RobinSparkles]|nr:HNH endonuclease [Gordonia phage RobinSparkles]
MGYKDPIKRSAYQNEWLKKRRNEWLKENGPCVKCGSWENLEVDHKDRSKKITSSVWSWSAEKRNKELAKCQVLCKSCHLEKTILEVDRGEKASASVLTEVQVIDILSRPNESGIKLGKEYGVSKYAIYKIRRGLSWTHIPRP